MRRVKFCFALIICLVVLLLLQALLVPKYMESLTEGALIGEYYANAQNNDVIFIGDCEVYENFSPITLWEEYGITSYIRGSAQQTIWQSYYLMEETFKYETPKVIVFNVLSMKYDTPASTGRSEQREAYNRMTLDTMRWSKSKWDSINASMTEKEKERESIFSYIFPLLRYHDRWSELSSEDFKYWFKRDEISHNGYLMQLGVKPFTHEYAERPLADYSFGENSWFYLKKMADLCEEKGTKLVLVKAPSLSPVWWDEWDRQIKDFAVERGLTYVNMLEYQDDIGIDWTKDTYDAGLHLNVYGAEKASLWFGKILSNDLDVSDRRSDEAISEIWSAKVEKYNRQKGTLPNEED